MQGLFATHSMGISQQPPAYNTKNSVQQQPSSNITLNSQYFATQGISSQGFGTPFNVNAQQFGTQNLMGQQQGFGQ